MYVLQESMARERISRELRAAEIARIAAEARRSHRLAASPSASQLERFSHRLRHPRLSWSRELRVRLGR
jgi:hypothetical protein